MTEWDAGQGGQESQLELVVVEASDGVGEVGRLMRDGVAGSTRR